MQGPPNGNIGKATPSRQHGAKSGFNPGALRSVLMAFIPTRFKSTRTCKLQLEDRFSEQAISDLLLIDLRLSKIYHAAVKFLKSQIRCKFSLGEPSD